jgi:hypothetical protein
VSDQRYRIINQTAAIAGGGNLIHGNEYVRIRDGARAETLVDWGCAGAKVRGHHQVGESGCTGVLCWENGGRHGM